MTADTDSVSSFTMLDADAPHEPNGPRCPIDQGQTALGTVLPCSIDHWVPLSAPKSQLIVIPVLAASAITADGIIDSLPFQSAPL